MKMILISLMMLFSTTVLAMGRGPAECYSSNPSYVAEGYYSFTSTGYLFNCKTQVADEVATLNHLKEVAEKCALNLCQHDGAKDCVLSHPAQLVQTTTYDKHMWRVCVAKASAYSMSKAAE